QRKIFEAIWEGRDCVTVLPTGFGKSLPYHAIIPAKRQQGVTFRLLMEDLVSRLRSLKIRALYKGDSFIFTIKIGAYKPLYFSLNIRLVESRETDEQAKRGDFDILFASPETLVGDEEWRYAIKEIDVSLIVVDEFHTVTEWGKTDKGKVAFRKWFRHLGELRSLCPYAALLAVSATCTRKVYKKKDAFVIRMSPNKSNIKLSVRKAKSLEITLFPIVEMIQCKQVHRLLIYCSTIKEVSECYRYLVNECLEDSGVMIQMYHSETTKDIKHSVQGILRNPDSKAIIIATSALGLGLDVANCNSVIIYGLPKSVIDLMQEMGR
ncbi:RECQ-like protein, partial [Mya arenaria]